MDSLATDFAALVADPSRAKAVPREQVVEILGALEKARAALWTRLLGPRDEAPAPDRLLTVDEAASRLAVARNWLRRRSELPFVIRLSGGNVRYSEQGIERFIQRQRRS